MASSRGPVAIQAVLWLEWGKVGRNKSITMKRASRAEEEYDKPEPTLTLSKGSRV